MTNVAAQFTGEIPKTYDEGLGPVLFVPYAEDMAARVKRLNPAGVVELAAGTGILTRRLRDALPASTSILATDLNEAMLEVARPGFGQDENVTFEVADAMAIPHEGAGFDLVACQFGIMFFPDKVASYREALRVLNPGGTYLFSTWGSWAENPWAEQVHQTVAGFFQADPPMFYKVPFHYHDQELISRELEEAGFINVRIERVAKLAEISSHTALAHAAVFGNPLVDEIRALATAVTPEQVRDAVRDVLAESFGPAPATMPTAALVVTAERPAG